MNYLRNKKSSRKLSKRTIIFLLILAMLFYFHAPLFKAFANVAQFIFRPLFSLGNEIDFGSPFVSKRKLINENESLKAKLVEYEASLSNHNSVLAENESLKESMSRFKEGTDVILGTILSKPNRSLYDTLLIDVGVRHGVVVGSIVFAKGDIPIGRVEEVLASSSKVVLFSSAGMETDVFLSSQDMIMKIVGRGGGNFEINIPRDLKLEKGEEAVLPGIQAYTVAILESIISDPRDAFSKALLVSPVNIQNLKFVEIKI